MITKALYCSGRITTRLGHDSLVLILSALIIPAAVAQVPEQTQTGAPHEGGGEASLVLPDLGQVDFHGFNARTLLTGRTWGLHPWTPLWLGYFHAAQESSGSPNHA